MEMAEREALNLASLVAYQEGAVVSRTLLQRDSGTVTLFAFDAGQALSEHTAPFDALVYVVDGEATVTIAGTDHTLNTGEVILMPANMPHALGAPQAFKMLLVMLRRPGDA